MAGSLAGPWRSEGYGIQQQQHPDYNALTKMLIIIHTASLIRGSRCQEKGELSAHLYKKNTYLNEPPT